jgi:hypothetical protein
MAITATGELCYKKGGSALAYSKITNNNGALICKYGTDIYVIVWPFMKWQDLESGIPDHIYLHVDLEGDVYTPISGYTQKITKLNNEHITLVETTTSIAGTTARLYAVRLDGITGNDSVDISYTVSFSLGSHKSGYIHGNVWPWSMHVVGNYRSSRIDSTDTDVAYTEEDIHISSSQLYVTCTWKYRITTNVTNIDNWLTIEKL